VVVTGQRAAAQTLIDRKVYTVTTDLQAMTGVAADVLNNVPSVAVDVDGNITLRGDGNITILVDGKPSAQFSGASRGQSLLDFPANQIDRIEVLANPPAQYKAEGSGGVINIVTKKTRQAGASGGVQASLGDKRRYVLSADGAYNSGALKLSGGLGLRQDYRIRLIDDHRTAIDPTTTAPVASAQSLDERLRRLSPSAKAGIDYTFNDRQSVGASFNHRESSGGRFFDQLDASGPPGAALTRQSDRHSDGFAWEDDTGEEAHFEQKLWRPGETLNLALQHSGDHERERYTYRNSFTLPVMAPTFDDLHLSHDLVKTEVSADYDLPLAGQRELRVGYDFEADRNAFDSVGDTLDPSSGAPILNPAVTSHFRYRQDVNAVYGQYQTPIGPWALQAGLRVESAEVSTLQLIGNVPGGRRDTGAYPSVHLDRAFGEDAKLSASVARRITRPDPEALDPHVDSQDTHNLRAGNPNLLPRDTWSYQLGYTATPGSASYGVTAYYRFDRDSVTDVLKPVSGDVVLATKANLPKSRSAGVEFSAYGKLGPKLTYRLSGDAFYSQIDALALGSPGLRSTTGVNLKASLDWRPTSADTAQVSVARTDKRLTPQGFVSPLTIVNLGYRHQLRPDLTLIVTVADALNGQRFQRIITTPALQDDYVRRQSGRIAYLGLTYAFGAQKKAKQPGFDYEP
jgi:outer membrane receptor protein involved in Fe transport